MIPEDAVEAAVAALYGDSLEVLGEFGPDMRIALEAVGPMLMARAWSEGWDAGAGWPQQDINPYDATK